MPMKFDPLTDSVIPSGVVASVISTNGDRRLYTLWKDGKIIVIQASTVYSPSQLERSDITINEFIELRAKYMEGLEQIKTLVHTIEFGKTNWGYLIPNHKGGFVISQKNKILPPVKYPKWAQPIPRREINFVRFWDNVRMWNGYWNGQEIDVLVAVDERTISLLEFEMEGYQRLEGLDLTYKVYGHVVDDDDAIMGLAYEPHCGRLMKYADRSIVYDALARVQQRKLIYCGAAEFQSIHIMDGKVRLTNLCSIWFIPDDEDRKEHGTIRHWQNMEKHFWLMKAGNDNTTRPVLHRRLVPEVTLLHHISPDRPLVINFDFHTQREKYRKRYYKELLNTNSLRKPSPFVGVTRPIQRSGRRIDQRARAHRTPRPLRTLSWTTASNSEDSEDLTCIELTSPALDSTYGTCGPHNSGSDSGLTLVEETYIDK